MINHVFSVICDRSSIDTETNTASIFGVLEQLTVFTRDTGLIKLPIQFELFSHWSRMLVDQPAKGKMRVYFCSPTGDKNVRAESIIDLSSVVFYRIRIRINGIELSGPGLYKFVIEYQASEDVEWVEVAQLPILVTYDSSKQ